MYRSNRSFNITLDNRPGLYHFWKTSVKIPPSPGQKVVQIPHHRSILGDAGDSNSVPDPDLEIRAGPGHPDLEIRAGLGHPDLEIRVGPGHPDLEIRAGPGHPDP